MPDGKKPHSTGQAMGLYLTNEVIMTQLLEKTNVKKVAEHLQLLQAEFNKGGLLEHLRAKPLLDMEVDKNEIAIFFELDKETDLTVVFNTVYVCQRVADISIRHIEVDSSEGVYEIDEGDHSALVLEGKRIIHDAVHYKLLNEDNAIDTNFYDDVYSIKSTPTLEKKTVYGVCNVTFFWSYHETQAGSPYCIIEKLMVGNNDMIEMPITDDDKGYWAEQGLSVCALDCYWSADEAEAHDRTHLECYTECPDCGVVGCTNQHDEVTK